MLMSHVAHRLAAELKSRLAAPFVARPEWHDAIVTFFSEQFVAREPFAKSLGLTPEGFRPMAEVLVSDAIVARHCFVTRSATGAITSVLLVRDATVPPSGDISSLCPSAAPIHKLLDAISERYLAAHPAERGKTLEGMFMLVDQTIENRSTSHTLWLACFFVCGLQGFRNGYACLTNPRSQRLFRSIGGTTVDEMQAGPFFESLGCIPQGDPGVVMIGEMDLKRAVLGLEKVARKAFRRRFSRSTGAHLAGDRPR